jgi:hypothetical protein
LTAGKGEGIKKRLWNGLGCKSFICFQVIRGRSIGDCGELTRSGTFSPPAEFVVFCTARSDSIGYGAAEVTGPVGIISLDGLSVASSSHTKAVGRLRIGHSTSKNELRNNRGNIDGDKLK